MRRLSAVILFALLLLASARVAAVPGGPVSSAESLDEVLSAHDYDSSDGDILRLYQAFFRRLPDVAGTKYWIGIARSGFSLDEIAGWFADSDEFRSTYGAVDDRRFLEIVYENVLGRGYDQAGFEYWLALLEAELTRGGVVRWVAANDEFIALHPFSPTSAAPPAVETRLPAPAITSVRSSDMRWPGVQVIFDPVEGALRYNISIAQADTGLVVAGGWTADAGRYDFGDLEAGRLYNVEVSAVSPSGVLGNAAVRTARPWIPTCELTYVTLLSVPQLGSFYFRVDGTTDRYGTPRPWLAGLRVTGRLQVPTPFSLASTATEDLSLFEPLLGFAVVPAPPSGGFSLQVWVHTSLPPSPSAPPTCSWGGYLS